MLVIAHPLAQTLARARELNEYLKPAFGQPSGDSWIAAPADFAPGSSHLAALIAAAQARLRTKAAAIVGSAVLQSYQWPLVSTAVACYLLDRRVPDLDPANTRTHYNAEHAADALALLSGRFTALPDDLAADHPDATVVSDLDTLRATLRASVEAHLAVVIDQLCARLGCKPRGLWLNVADALASTLVWLAQERGTAAPLAALESEVDALIRVPGSPLHTHKVGLIELTCAEHSHVYLDRATCCYWYKCAGGDYCSTCPHRTPEDRRERLLSQMAAAHAPAEQTSEAALA